MTAKRLTKSQISSKAQAQAHKELREKHPDEYKDAYQRAKTEMTEENTR